MAARVLTMKYVKLSLYKAESRAERHQLEEEGEPTTLHSVNLLPVVVLELKLLECNSNQPQSSKNSQYQDVFLNN